MTHTRFLFIAAFMMDLCTSLAVFTIPLTALDLGASVVELGLVGTTGSAAFTIACLFTGKWADRYDRRRLMGVAGLCAAGVYLLLFFVTRLWMLLVYAALAWMTLAMFWPALQATLAEGLGRAKLARTLGTFNMVWTVGFMNGPLFGGLLYEAHPRLPFLAGLAGMVMLSAAIFFWRPDAQNEPDNGETEPVIEPEPEPGDTVRFRPVAWVASFTTFFVTGIINNQFPKLATELLISPVVLGYLLAIPRLVQFWVFFLVRRTQFWQYRLYPLTVTQAGAVIGMLVVMFVDSPVVIGLAFTTVGLLIGASFSASQFYAFFQEERKGERGAFNEMIIGLGFVSGPLLGGIAAQALGLRAPYVLCCAVLIAGMLIEYRLASRGAGYRASGKEVES